MATIDRCPRCGFNRMGGECPDHPRMVPPAASLADRRRQEFMRLANECEARLLMEVANRIGVLGSSISDALPRPPVARPRRSWWQRVLAVFYGDPPDIDPDALLRYADAVANLRGTVNDQREGIEAQVRYYFGALRDGHPDNPRFDRMRAQGHLLTADGWLVNERAIDANGAGRDAEIERLTAENLKLLNSMDAIVHALEIEDYDIPPEEEIMHLRAKLEASNKELREIAESINDPRVNLTMTAAEWCIEAQAKLEAAERDGTTRQNAGNIHPIESLLLSAEKEDAVLRAQLAARDAEVGRLREALEAVDAWDINWADGLDENVERIKDMVRAALKGEDAT